jgi:excisionase family DNA binding protein
MAKDDWITTAEAAEISGYHPVYLLELFRTKKIKARKFGPVWQVSTSDLKAYIKAARGSKDKRRGARVDKT